MFELRIHGRGGQGVVTAAELLALAAFREGRQAQAFPSFGSERMGAPVVAFCRIDSAPIRRREPIAEPDAVLVQDPTLLHHVDVFGGLRPDGFVLINSKHSLDRLGLAELRDRLPREHAHTVPASELARTRSGRPIPNAAMLGGLCALVSVVGLQAVEQAIGERFGERAAAANAAAARDSYEHVRRSLSGAEAARA